MIEVMERARARLFAGGLRKVRWKIFTLIIICCCGFWLLIISPEVAFMMTEKLSMPTYFPLISENMSSIQEVTIATTASNFRGLPPDDESTLIDLKDFRFTINHFPCYGSNPIFVTLVHSAPGNFAKRSIIRETWGAPDFGVVHLFFIGASAQHQIQILKEDEEHMDIIQGNFQDAYRNLTYKHAMVLKWATYYCPSAQYIVKVDDDIFVNIPAMVEYLKSDLSPGRDIYCHTLDGSPVLRNNGSKWCVEPHEYSGERYPIYCLGYAVIYTSNSVFQLYSQVQKEPYFWIDDVHVTGTLVKQLNLTHGSLGPALSLNHERMHKLFANSSEGTDFLFGPPNTGENDIRAMLNVTRSKNQLDLKSKGN